MDYCDLISRVLEGRPQFCPEWPLLIIIQLNWGNKSGPAIGSFIIINVLFQLKWDGGGCREGERMHGLPGLAFASQMGDF